MTYQMPNDHAPYVEARARTGARAAAPVREIHTEWIEGHLILRFEIGNPVGVGRGYEVEVTLDPAWILGSLRTMISRVRWSQ